MKSTHTRKSGFYQHSSGIYVFGLLILLFGADVANANPVTNMFRRFSVLFAASHTETSDNKFRPLNPPGKVVDGVNVFTGQYATSIPLATISAGGVAYPVSLQYGGSAQDAAENDSVTAARSKVGWDWNLSEPFVQTEQMGTKTLADDIFWCDLGPWGAGELVFLRETVVDGVTTRVYVLSSNPSVIAIAEIQKTILADLAPFLVVANGEILGWKFTLLDGTILKFGYRNQAIRTVRSNPLSVVSDASAIMRVPYRWDIADVYDFQKQGHIQFNWSTTLYPSSAIPLLYQYEGYSQLQSIEAFNDKNESLESLRFSYSCPVGDELCVSDRRGIIEQVDQRPLQDRHLVTKITQTQFLLPDPRTVTHTLTYAYPDTKMKRPFLQTISSELNAGTGSIALGEYAFEYTAQPLTNTSGAKNLRLSKITYPTKIVEDISYGTASIAASKAVQIVDNIQSISSFTNQVNQLQSWCDEQDCFLVEQTASTTMPAANQGLKVHAWRNTGNYFQSTEIISQEYQPGLSDLSVLHGRGWYAVVDKLKKTMHLFDKNDQGNYDEVNLVNTSKFFRDAATSIAWDVQSGGDYIVFKRYHYANAESKSKQLLSITTAPGPSEIAILTRDLNRTWKFSYSSDEGAGCQVHNKDLLEYKGTKFQARFNIVDTSSCLIYDTDVSVSAGSNYFTVLSQKSIATGYLMGSLISTYESPRVLHVFGRNPSGTGVFTNLSSKLPVVDTNLQETQSPMLFKQVVSSVDVGSRFLQITLNPEWWNPNATRQLLMQLDGVKFSLVASTDTIQWGRIYQRDSYAVIQIGNKSADATKASSVNLYYVPYVMKSDGSLGFANNTLKQADFSKAQNWLGGYDFWDVNETRSDGSLRFQFNIQNNRENLTVGLMHDPADWMNADDIVQEKNLSYSLYSVGLPSFPNESSFEWGGTKVFWFNGMDPADGVRGGGALAPRAHNYLVGVAPTESGMIAWNVAVDDDPTKDAKSCPYELNCNFVPSFIPDGDISRTQSVSQYSADFHGIHPWNMTFSESGNKAILARVNPTTRKMKVWLTRNVNGTYFGSKPVVIVASRTITYPEALNPPQRTDFNYRATSFLEYNSTTQQMQASDVNIDRSIAVNGIDLFVNTEFDRMTVDRIGSPLPEESINLSGVVDSSNVVDRLNYTQMSQKIETETIDRTRLKDHNLWPAGVWLNRIVLSRSTQTDSYGNTNGSVSLFSNFTDLQTPTIVYNQVIGSNVTNISQKILETKTYRNADGESFHADVPTEQYAYKSYAGIHLGQTYTAPIVNQSTSDIYILNAQKTIWSEDYPGIAMSHYSWVDLPDMTNQTSPSSPVSPLFSLSNSFVKTDSVTVINSSGRPVEAFTLANAEEQYSSTLYRGIRSLPTVQFRGARASQVAALTGENGRDIEHIFSNRNPLGYPQEKEDSVSIPATSFPYFGFAHSGQWSILFNGGRVDLNTAKFTSAIQRPLSYTFSGWVFSKNPTAPSIGMLIVSGSGNVLVQGSAIAPIEPYAPRKWQKWEVVVDLKHVPSDVLVAKGWVTATKSSDSEIYLDDFVLAPTAATYVISGYDGSGQKISESAEDQVQWFHYSKLGVLSGAADENGLMYKQNALHRFEEDAK